LPVNRLCAPGALAGFLVARHSQCVGKTKGKNYIRAWREFRQMSQEELAEKVGSSHSTLSRVERGIQPYNQLLLEDLATELRCTVADLLIRNPMDPEGIWSIWDALSPPQRRQAIAVISAIKQSAT
jgi:transcriptional regulator with XRE-family HTH domain